MDFKSYLAQVERTYHYRVKSVAPLDDAAMTRIERGIEKYDPIEVGRVRSTMLQRQPLDFPNVQNSEVYMFDLELGLPVSAYILQNDLRTMLGLPDGYVVVRTDNDPIELQTEKLDADADLNAAAADDGMAPAALLTEPDYPEAKPINGADYYGNSYNSRLLDYLQDVSRKSAEARKVDAPNALTGWGDQPESDVSVEDFNADIKDIVRPSTGKSKTAGKNAKTAPSGNFDDDTSTIRRVFTDGNKVVTRTAQSQPIRKGDK